MVCAERKDDGKLTVTIYGKSDPDRLAKHPEVLLEAWFETEESSGELGYSSCVLNAVYVECKSTHTLSPGNYTLVMKATAIGETSEITRTVNIP